MERLDIEELTPTEVTVASLKILVKRLEEQLATLVDILGHHHKALANLAFGLDNQETRVSEWAIQEPALTGEWVGGTSTKVEENRDGALSSSSASPPKAEFYTDPQNLPGCF